MFSLIVSMGLTIIINMLPFEVFFGIGESLLLSEISKQAASDCIDTDFIENLDEDLRLLLDDDFDF